VITVYSRPDCEPCKATIRKLNQLGLPHQKIDVTEEPDALDYIRGLGYLQAPVVVAGDDHWSGYRPHRIKELADGAETLGGRTVTDRTE
jgi:glutaredoxin-like protein NrdH